MISFRCEGRHPGIPEHELSLRQLKSARKIESFLSSIGKLATKFAVVLNFFFEINAEIDLHILAIFVRINATKIFYFIG